LPAYDGHEVWAAWRVYAAEQQRRERLRLEAAGRFARGGGVSETARDLSIIEARIVEDKVEISGRAAVVGEGILRL
jgi:hypothetical protein